MATRSPASVALPNFRSTDWYEPYTGWTAQTGTACPLPLTSDVIYGHDTWDAVEGELVAVNPIMVEYGS